MNFLIHSTDGLDARLSKTLDLPVRSIELSALPELLMGDRVYIEKALVPKLALRLALDPDLDVGEFAVVAEDGQVLEGLPPFARMGEFLGKPMIRAGMALRGWIARRNRKWVLFSLFLLAALLLGVLGASGGILGNLATDVLKEILRPRMGNPELSTDAGDLVLSALVYFSAALFLGVPAVYLLYCVRHAFLETTLLPVAARRQSVLVLPLSFPFKETGPAREAAMAKFRNDLEMFLSAANNGKSAASSDPELSFHAGHFLASNEEMAVLKSLAQAKDSERDTLAAKRLIKKVGQGFSRPDETMLGKIEDLRKSPWSQTARAILAARDSLDLICIVPSLETHAYCLSLEQGMGAVDLDPQDRCAAEKFYLERFLGLILTRCPHPDTVSRHLWRADWLDVRNLEERLREASKQANGSPGRPVGIMIVPPVDYEMPSAVHGRIEELLKALPASMRENATVDVTGGSALFSVGAALATINTGVRFCYMGSLGRQRNFSANVSIGAGL